jgi:hypothetical protein
MTAGFGYKASDDVLICDEEEIINTDENGEKASVRRIK